jgi:hypothetical protein
MADNMDPQDAIKQISEKLVRSASGQLSRRVPTGQPILDLFGVQTTRPLKDQTNYYDTALKSGLQDFLPEGLAVTPEGKPFVGAQALENMRLAASARSALKPEDQPSKELGTAVLESAKEIYGENHARFKTLKTYLDTSGGVPLSKLAELNSSLVRPTKELDAFNTPYGPAWRERGTGKIVYALDPKQSPIATSILTKEGDRYGSDSVVKELRTMLAQVPTFETLLDSNNPAARGSIEGFATRVLGREKGVMTDQDVLRNTGSRALADRFKRWVNTHATGELTNTDLTDFGNLVRDIRNASERVLKQTEDTYVKRAGSTFKRLKIPITDDELRDQITLQAQYGIYNGSDNPLAQKLTGVTPKVKDEPLPTEQGGQTKKGTKYRIIQ